jgi:hypothetical protein
MPHEKRYKILLPFTIVKESFSNILKKKLLISIPGSEVSTLKNYVRRVKEMENC